MTEDLLLDNKENNAFHHYHRVDSYSALAASCREACLQEAGPSGSLSRNSSFDSIEPELLISDHFSSEELDKLSSCLSEVSSDSGKETTNSVFYDVLQAQLALWTCVFSLLYSYAWRQHRKKFLMSILFVVPTVFSVCCVISSLLTTIVLLGRIFSAPFNYREFLDLPGNLINKRSVSPTPLMRTRCHSGASTVSWQSDSDPHLPRPLCRRHSSNGSVCGGSISRPPSQATRKLSYVYSHQSATDDHHDI